MHGLQAPHPHGHGARSVLLRHRAAAPYPRVGRPMSAPFTLADLDAYALLREAATGTWRVRWAVGNGGGTVANGVARAFTDADGAFLRSDVDVRQGYLWLSGVVERFMPLAEAAELMKRGELYVDEP